jgi:hypothetical protein
MLNEEIELLDFVSKARFEIGVLDKDGNSLIKSFLDLPAESKEITAAEAMFFVDYGTATIPGRFLLERLTHRAEKMLDERLTNLVSEILDGKHTRGSVEKYLTETALRIRDFSRLFVYSEGAEKIHLSKKDEENGANPPAVCDFKELSKHIDCSVKFAN